MLLAAALPSLPASALPGDGFDPEPLPDIERPFVAPPGGFAWSVPSRLRFRAWNELGEPAVHPGPSETYDAAYVHPSSFPVDFDGCPSEEETDREDAGQPTVNTYVWEVAGTTVSQQSCRYRRVFPAEGTYPAKLTITNGSTTIGTYSQSVTVQDLLIVSLGDSYASGEGNPDIPQVPGFFWPGIDQEVDWLDDRCHRSALSGPAQAALRLERSDPKTSVTFLSFACSGATVDTDYFTGGNPLDPYEPATGDRIGSGVLGSYAGAAPPGGDVTNHVPPQIDQLRSAITVTDAAGTPVRDGNGDLVMRRVDALVLSGGGNDIGFGPIATVCVLYGPYCPDNLVGAPNGGPEIPLRDRFAADVGTMAGKYQRLATALSTLPVTEVFLTEYPDPTTDQSGNTCGEMLEDVIPPLSLWHLVNPLFPLWLKAVVVASNLVRFHIQGAEVSWARSTVLPGLNGAVQAATAAHGWTYVGGIANDFIGHGYCSTNSWIRRAADSTQMQGPYPAIVNDSTKGTLHPTVAGHASYARHIYQAVSTALGVAPSPSLAAPAFSSATSIGSTTSAVGAHGWLTGPAVLTVDVRADGAEGQNGIRATSASINGADGCPPQLACTASLVDARNHRWTFEATASGTYRLDFSASDWWEQTTQHGYELKVDLEDPATEAQLEAGHAPTSPGWYRTPVDVSLTGTDPPGGSGIASVQYRLNGGPVVTAGTDAAVKVATDGSHSVEHRAVDHAGRIGPWATTTFAIDTVAPTVTCASADGSWHAHNVNVDCSAGDDRSGLLHGADAQFSLTTTVADGTETAQASTGQRPICDRAGNCTTAGPVTGHRIDRKAPRIQLGVPANGAAYLLGAALHVSYACVDGGSGISSCTGTLANGSALPTSSAGNHAFTVAASDAVANSSQVEHSYAVTYRICPLYDQDRTLGRAGSVVPIRVSLCDATGANVSSPSITLTATSVDGTSPPPDTVGQSNPDQQFRYDASLDGYVYNLTTRGLTSGVHTLTFEAEGDPIPHSVSFVLR